MVSKTENPRPRTQVSPERTLFVENEEEFQEGVKRISEAYFSLRERVRSGKALKRLQWDDKAFELDDQIVAEISSRVHKDKARIRFFHPEIKEPDRYKVGGFYTYWISKLKPIRFKKKNLSRLALELNEYLALVTGYIRATQGQEFLFITPEGVEDIIYGLRYRNISSDALAIIFRQMRETEKAVGKESKRSRKGKSGKNG